MVNYHYIINNYSPKNKTTKTHYHSSYEFIFYYQASGNNHYINDLKHPKLNKLLVYDTKNIKKDSLTFNVTSNSFIVYEPYIIHNETLLGSSKVFAIVFDLAPELHINTCSFQDIDGTIQKLVNLILREYEKKEFGFNLIINALMTELIVKIKRNFLSTKKETPPIIQAITYINDYFAEQIDIKQLASSIGYSADHFRVLFKKQTGISPKKYILNKRIELAKNQIIQNKISLTEIAQICGYDDYYQFSSLFKKHTGMSPIDFKRKNKIFKK